MKKFNFQLIEKEMQVLSQNNKFKKYVFEVYDQILIELKYWFKNML